MIVDKVNMMVVLEMVLTVVTPRLLVGSWSGDDGASGSGMVMEVVVLHISI